MEKKRIKIGIIGFGRMGGMHLHALQQSDLWDVAYICDVSETCRAEASVLAPDAMVTDDEDIVFSDPEVEVVSLCALADSQPTQIEKAIRYGKHVIAEKPIGANVKEEMEIVEKFEKSGLLSTVNLY
ncbi:MAG: Gfo/Idh/MocA family oxidoreductase, partial [Muribaculaceae bacterium]|nr:Gfo/Idh/MocA family oxidoreductase [Muribaculaceae bacterium]